LKTGNWDRIAATVVLVKIASHFEVLAGTNHPPVQVRPWFHAQNHPSPEPGPEVGQKLSQGTAIAAPPARCASHHAKRVPSDFLLFELYAGPGTKILVVPKEMHIQGDPVMTFIVDGLQRPVSTVSVSLGIISLLYLRSRRRNTL
jgi:hypothetical protein